MPHNTKMANTQSQMYTFPKCSLNCGCNCMFIMLDYLLLYDLIPITSVGPIEQHGKKKMCLNTSQIRRRFNNVWK